MFDDIKYKKVIGIFEMGSFVCRHKLTIPEFISEIISFNHNFPECNQVPKYILTIDRDDVISCELMETVLEKFSLTFP